MYVVISYTQPRELVESASVVFAKLEKEPAIDRDSTGDVTYAYIFIAAFA